MAFCTECGANIPEGVRFCTSCGHPADAAAPVSAAPVGAPPVVTPPIGMSPPVGTPPAAAAPMGAPLPAVTPAPVIAAPMGTPPAATPPVVPYAQPARPTRGTPEFAAGAGGAPPKGSRYAVIGTLSYIGTFILFAIPIVGLVFCIVWACGRKTNLNRRNLSRAVLVFMIAGIVLSVACYFLFAWMYEAFMEYLDEATGGLLNDFGDLGGLGGLGDLSGMLGAQD